MRIAVYKQFTDEKVIVNSVLIVSRLDTEAIASYSSEVLLYNTLRVGFVKYLNITPTTD